MTTLTVIYWEQEKELFFKSAHFIHWHVVVCYWEFFFSIISKPPNLFRREMLNVFIFHFQMQCHTSPIYTLARNPSFLKNFMTVGDWNARIWSEDCKESSIIWTKYCTVELTDGCWSPTKCSLFYLSRQDGSVEAWDLLQQQSEPVLTIKVGKLRWIWCSDLLLQKLSLFKF